MDMIDKLKNYQINADEARRYFTGKPAMYDQMLEKLPEAVEKLNVLEYMKAGDYKNALENAHALKGITGNLSIPLLYNAYTDIVQLLRDKKNQEAQDVLEEIMPFQEDIINIIREH